MTRPTPLDRAHRTPANPIVAVAAASFFIAASASTTLAQYEPPANYYSGITNQTGASLKTALTAAMSSGHVQTSYAQARDYLPFTDANPDNLTQMFEFYTHTIIQKPSASHIGFTGLYQSREHVWPDSLQGPGDTSNSTTGSRGDIHMLKPLSQSVNSSRGNNAFGGANLTGAARNIGNSQWFPGSTDKGDAARIIFYGATRWASTLSVVNGNPTTNTQMGDLSAMLRHHYQDAPDLFERRNDTIARGDDVRTTGDDSPFAGTRNRNAYIDRPEYVWSVFVDQQNDTQLSVGTPSADGSSSATVDLGRVLRNAPVPTAQNVTLNKTGVDGTYYSVTTEGSATSSVTGRFNAFTMDSAGSRSLQVGLNTTTATPGLKSGAVTIDNLDVTTQGGTGRGGNDGNDRIDVRLSVLDVSNPSFSSTSDLSTFSIDFGTVPLNTTSDTQAFTLNNLASTLGTSLTAGLDLDTISKTGDISRFTSPLTSFDALAAGTGIDSAIHFATDQTGKFNAVYTLHFSDEDLPGTAATSSLTLNLVGAAAQRGDTNYDARVDFTDLLTLAQNYGATEAGTWSTGDFNRDGSIDFNDLLALAQNYGFGSALALDPNDGSQFAADWALAQSMVPEPAVATLTLALFAPRRRSRRSGPLQR